MKKTSVNRLVAASLVTALSLGLACLLYTSDAADE